MSGPQSLGEQHEGAGTTGPLRDKNQIAWEVACLLFGAVLGLTLQIGWEWFDKSILNRPPTPAEKAQKLDVGKSEEFFRDILGEVEDESQLKSGDGLHVFTWDGDGYLIKAISDSGRTVVAYSLTAKTDKFIPKPPKPEERPEGEGMVRNLGKPFENLVGSAHLFGVSAGGTRSEWRWAEVYGPGGATREKTYLFAAKYNEHQGAEWAPATGTSLTDLLIRAERIPGSNCVGEYCELADAGNNPDIAEVRRRLTVSTVAVLQEGFELKQLPAGFEFGLPRT